MDTATAGLDVTDSAGVDGAGLGRDVTALGVELGLVRVRRYVIVPQKSGSSRDARLTVGALSR